MGHDIQLERDRDRGATRAETGGDRYLHGLQPGLVADGPVEGHDEGFMGGLAEGNDTYACDNSNCMLSCSSPKFGPRVCYGMQQNFLDGTPCTGGGTCQNVSIDAPAFPSTLILISYRANAPTDLSVAKSRAGSIATWVSLLA